MKRIRFSFLIVGGHLVEVFVLVGGRRAWQKRPEAKSCLWPSTTIGCLVIAVSIDIHRPQIDPDRPIYEQLTVPSLN
jgi:hypothetical protein